MTARSSIAEVVAALRRGGVVAYPTEAVWGLGCDPRDETAVTKLLALQQRPVEKGMILIVSAAKLASLRSRGTLSPMVGKYLTCGSCVPASVKVTRPRFENETHSQQDYLTTLSSRD